MKWNGNQSSSGRLYRWTSVREALDGMGNFMVGALKDVQFGVCE